MSMKVKKLFEKYANDPADKEDDDRLFNKIGPHGVMRLLGDLKLEAEDRKVLIMAFKMNAEVMCEFSWAEWEKGMTDMQVDSVASLRKRLDDIDKAATKDPSQLKPVYKFAFTYGKSLGCRNLDVEVAIVYWKILYRDQFPLLALWEEYMTTKYKKPVTKDTWNLLFDFATTIRADLSNYDEEESWPVVLDNFVTWARPKVAAGSQ